MGGFLYDAYMFAGCLAVRSTRFSSSVFFVEVYSYLCACCHSCVDNIILNNTSDCVVDVATTICTVSALH